MGKINGHYCRQYAMSLSAGVDKSGDNTVLLDILDKEAKRLDTNNLLVDVSFKEKLQHYLEEILAYDDNGMNNSIVNKEILKAEYQADYIIAYCVMSGGTDVIFSSDSDFAALTTQQSICIKGMRLDTTNARKRKENV